VIWLEQSGNFGIEENDRIDFELLVYAAEGGSRAFGPNSELLYLKS
jgi:hypothetical protein